MDKSDFCQCLFDDIKDDIEFDSDVIALESLLLRMLEFNVVNSFNNWKYLILKYDIETLMMDIDFLPIIKDYPENLFRKVGVNQFFKYMEDVPANKLKLIYKYLFNVYSPDCFIYRSLSYYIKKNDNREEKILIKSILDKSNDFSQLIFDKSELIKQVILLHIKYKKFPTELLKELINEIDNKKEQAILKTLLIDYLIF